MITQLETFVDFFAFVAILELDISKTAQALWPRLSSTYICTDDEDESPMYRLPDTHTINAMRIM